MRYLMRLFLVWIGLTCCLAGATQAAAPTITKTPTLSSDPIDGSTLPKAIPGAVVDYDIAVKNPNVLGSLGSIVITDNITDISIQGAEYYVGLNNANPVTITDGILGLLSTGLTFTWGGLASTTDSFAFSCDKGITWTCTPQPDAAGYDPRVTNIRISPTNSFAALSGFNLRIRIRVKAQ